MRLLGLLDKGLDGLNIRIHYYLSRFTTFQHLKARMRYLNTGQCLRHNIIELSGMGSRKAHEWHVSIYNFLGYRNTNGSVRIDEIVECLLIFLNSLYGLFVRNGCGNKVSIKPL